MSPTFAFCYSVHRPVSDVVLVRVRTRPQRFRPGSAPLLGSSRHWRTCAVCPDPAPPTTSPTSFSEGRVVAVLMEAARRDMKDASILPTVVQVTISIRRGPAMQGARGRCAGVRRGHRGLETSATRRYFRSIVGSRRTSTNCSITSNDIDLDLPVSKILRGGIYGIIAGFQLSPDELATNRHTGGA